MNYIYIGEVVNTHGIKGEIRIISNFQYKDKVFIKDMTLYLGSRHQKMTINTYRKHKNFDMVTLKGINNINDAIIFKGDKVYIDRNSIEINGYFDEDLIGINVVNDDKIIGKVEKIIDTLAHRIIVISGNKNYMIPYVNEYIKDIDLDNKTMTINVIKGLLDED